MKKMFYQSCIGIIIFIFLQAIFGIVLAENESSIPFSYNVLPTVKRESIIDSKATPTLAFRLYEPVEAIFYNGKQVTVMDDMFSIDVSDLSGKCMITFTNQNGDKAMFQYYFPNAYGKVDDYELVKGEDLNVYVETYRNIKIIYTDKEENAMEKLKEYIELLPENYTQNVKTIQMIPFDNTQNIAGTTKDTTITLYHFSQYAKQTKMQIIFHEIAHTFANKMMEKKIIDYSYSQYTKAAIKDRCFVSKYAQKSASLQSRLSEDFADAMAEYFMSSSFERRFPNRYAYLNSLLGK